MEASTTICESSRVNGKSRRCDQWKGDVRCGICRLTCVMGESGVNELIECLVFDLELVD
jgi:hypothetical protein